MDDPLCTQPISIQASKEFQVKLDFLEIFRRWFPSLAQLCHAAPDRARRANIQYLFSLENLNSLNPGELFLFNGILWDPTGALSVTLHQCPASFGRWALSKSQTKPLEFRNSTSFWSIHTPAGLNVSFFRSSRDSCRQRLVSNILFHLERRWFGLTNFSVTKV